jgi:hypothetical protein
MYMLLQHRGGGQAPGEEDDLEASHAVSWAGDGAPSRLLGAAANGQELRAPGAGREGAARGRGGVQARGAARRCARCATVQHAAPRRRARRTAPGVPLRGT